MELKQTYRSENEALSSKCLAVFEDYNDFARLMLKLLEDGNEGDFVVVINDHNNGDCSTEYEIAGGEFVVAYKSDIVAITNGLKNIVKKGETENA